MQLRSLLLYLSIVLDKTPDEVTKRSVVSKRDQKPQEELSPSATSLDAGLAQKPKLVENWSIKKMSNPRSVFVKIGAALTIVLAVTAGSLAKSKSKTDSNPALSNISIKNFGQMDDRFYRGGQPKEEEFQQLKALGVKTIIDLRNDPVSYERRDVESLGMRYVNIPMRDTDYPKEEQIQSFMKLVNDPVTGKFFVHCAGGKHQTGVVGAIYRFNHDHWTYDQAYAEMKNYNFSTAWGHGDMKKYVQDYWQKFQSTPVRTSAAAAATSNR